MFLFIVNSLSITSLQFVIVYCNSLGHSSSLNMRLIFITAGKKIFSYLCYP